MEEQWSHSECCGPISIAPNLSCVCESLITSVCTSNSKKLIHTDSQKEQLQRAGHEPVCLVPGAMDTCMCLIALNNRASTHILRAVYSADIGITNFGSPLDSVACCLMLVAGRPSASEIFELSATAQPDATCKLICTETTIHCILRRGPRAPAHTRSLAIALQSLF